MLDQATCHTTHETLQQFRRNRISPMFVPKRLTNLLQPADVSWLRSLKTAYATKWTDWITNNRHTFTAQGNMRSPGNANILAFINLNLIVILLNK